jgi:hypothetical protein
VFIFRKETRNESEENAHLFIVDDIQKWKNQHENFVQLRLKISADTAPVSNCTMQLLLKASSRQKSSMSVAPTPTPSKQGKGKKEKRRSQTQLNERLKIVVRRLPANLPEDIFWQSVFLGHRRDNDLENLLPRQAA